MSKYLALLIISLSLLSLSSQAATISWMEQTALGTSVAASSSVVGGIGTLQQAKNGGMYTYTPTTADETSDNSAVIDVRVCGGPGPTIVAWPDTSGLDYTGQAFVYACPTSTFSPTTCMKVLADIDGGGVDNVTLNGDDGSDRDASGTAEQRAWITGVTFPFIAVRHTVACTSNQCRVDLYCAHP